MKLLPVEKLLEMTTTQEIRRYSRSRGRVHDQRLDEDFLLEAGRDMHFDLDAFHARWIERSCLSEKELSWS